MSFYYRPNLFPPVIKNLLIINGLIFVAQETFGSGNPYFIENLFALHDVHSYYFRPHQLITYMFLHGSFDHILGNMLGLWVFGSVLENHWGGKRFLKYYLITGIGAGLLHLGVLYIEMKPVWDYINSFPRTEDIESKLRQVDIIIADRYVINKFTVGASGAIFGCIAGAGYLFPNMVVYFNFLIPVKMKWLALIYGFLELYLAAKNSAGDQVAHYAHIGGAITGIIVILIWNKTNRKTLY